MMPRRPMHLRWSYVTDHALLFGALTALLVAALALTALLVADPARGLLLGILPTVLALIVWALTNRAGYPDGAPATPVHQRSEGLTDPPEAPAWDPFDRDRPTAKETDHEERPEAAREEAAPASPATEPSSPTKPASERRVDPRGTPFGQPAKSATPAGFEKATAKPSKAPSQPRASESESNAQHRAKEKSHRGQTTPASAGQRERGARKPGSGDPFEPDSQTPPSVQHASNSGSEGLTPAEAAKRAAAARKRAKKRRGSPDPA